MPEPDARPANGRPAAPGFGRIALIVAAVVALLAVGLAVWRSRQEAAPTPVAAAAETPVGDVASAIGKLEARLKASPNDAQGWRMLGWSYYQTERFADAVAAYRRATLIEPANAEGWSALGEAVALAGKGELDVLFLLGADEYDMSAMGNAFVVYIGSHGDAAAHRADVILPGATYTEKSGTYVNTEGRVQTTTRAVFPPGDAKEDWAIVRALSGAIGKPLPFNSLSQLRSAIYAEVPHLARIDEIMPANGADLGTLAKAAIKTKSAPFKSPVSDFYLSNPIARASATMGECAALAAGLQQAAE